MRRTSKLGLKSSYTMSAAWKTFCELVPQRWVTVFVGFFGLLNAYSMRICLSLAITKMVIPLNDEVVLTDESCPENSEKSGSNKNGTDFGDGLYDWSEYTQGIILSSFYWGYIITNLLGGTLAERFGGRHTLGLGILSTSILTLLTPVCIDWGGSSALIALRVLMGLGEGTTYPALSALLAQWVPEQERSKAATLAFAGAPLGTIFGTMASGVILQNVGNQGWPAVFYFFGGVGLLAFLLNSALCYSRPCEHPFIGEAEAEYLRENLKSTHAQLPRAPWKHILRSAPVWAVVIAMCGNAWGFLTLVSDMPKYMSNVLKFSVQENGYFSSLPYFCMWLNSALASCAADWLIGSKRLTIGQVRKLGSSIASLGPGVFILAASYAGCDGSLVVALLTVGVTLQGCTMPSILVNALDLAPNYAGSLTGLITGISTLSGILSPYIVGVLTPGQKLSEWRLVFWIVFANFAVSNAVFLLFGSGELQEWNDPEFLEKRERRKRSIVQEEVELLTIKQ